MRSAGRSGFFTPFLGGACLVLAALVILLARQNHALRGRLERAAEHREAGAARHAPPLDAGDHLEPLPVFGEGVSRGGTDPGEGQTLRFTDARNATLLFLFAGGCSFCDEMAPAVARVATAGSPLGVAVIGVQTDAAKPADLKHTGLGFAVCGAADRRGTWLERAATVPGLALVDRAGGVRQVWWGVIDGVQEVQVLQAMERVATER